MRIIELTASNVKRLKAISIRPDGSLVVIGGNNANGKTSVLDSIMMALGGGDTIPERPIRDGESKAEITLDLGDYIVTRTISAKGTTLKVTDKDGTKIASPQTLLDGLTSRVSFDPLAFQRMNPAAQAAVLRQLVGVDFTALDAKRKQACDDRTQTNREIKGQQARVDIIPFTQNMPPVEIDVAELAEELKEVCNNNAQAATAARHLQETQEQYKSALDTVKRLESQLEEAQKRVKQYKPLDATKIGEQLKNAQEINQAVQQNARRKAEQEEVITLSKKADMLTKTIEQADAEKQAALENATYPVAGLGFSETGITFNGIPFEQSSGAEQLRVSVAIGIAMNPTLKVLLIRDGSLLDENNLEMIAEMAEESGGQVWLERVGKGDECAIIIEDGQVE